MPMVLLFVVSRRHFVKTIMAVGTFICGRLQVIAAEPRTGATKNAAVRLNPDEALHELMAGNERFASGRLSSPRRSPADFRQLAEGQHPFAAILSCADSRVPPRFCSTSGKAIFSSCESPATSSAARVLS